MRDPEEHIITTVENPAALAAAGAASVAVPGAAVITAAATSNGAVEPDSMPDKVSAGGVDCTVEKVVWTA